MDVPVYKRGNSEYSAIWTTGSLSKDFHPQYKCLFYQFKVNVTIQCNMQVPGTGVLSS